MDHLQRNTDANISTYCCGVDTLVVFKKEAIRAIEINYLNTPRLIADATGTTVWKWDQQEPFGVNVPDENPSGVGAFEFPPRFPGQYFDKETTLAYNYAREYDSSTGRYVQRDPIGLQGGLNTYSYVNDDPLQFMDPLGLSACNGSWRKDGWNTDDQSWWPLSRSRCTCNWTCRPCDGSPQFNETSKGTPTNNRNIPCYNPKSRSYGPCRPEYINDCRCEKPGPESSCACPA